jgi:hypothetical protein
MISGDMIMENRRTAVGMLEYNKKIHSSDLDHRILAIQKITLEV